MERFEFVSMFVKYDWNVFLRYHISTNCTGESCYGDPGSNYVFNVNNRRTRARCETCPKLTITTPERGQLSTYFTTCSSVSFANFEQANADW